MSKGKVVVLKDNFSEVRSALTGQMLQDSAMAGGFVVEGQAKINASKGGKDHLNIRTGTLVNSLKTTKGKKLDNFAESHIGTNVIYARIHELGGIIVPVFAKMLSWVNAAGERIFAGAVHMPARPYLRPAIDEKEEDIVKAVETEIWRNIDKVAR